MSFLSTENNRTEVIILKGEGMIIVFLILSNKIVSGQLIRLSWNICNKATNNFYTLTQRIK